MSILIIRTEDIIDEKWTFGRYEADGRYVENASDGDLVLSRFRFSSSAGVYEYIHKEKPDDEWSYTVYRLLTLSDYQEVEKI